MSVYEKMFHSVTIPRLYRVRRSLISARLHDLEGQLKGELHKPGALDQIAPGKTVAIAVGSREIANLAAIVRIVCDELKANGAVPFIFPAMGSHGGAVAENQKALIAHFGITEAAMGVPVRSSMETVHIGATPSGVPVYFDRIASGADYIIPIGRIKYHTCFRGEIESGLLKMLAVGCGKQEGASAMHKRGFPLMSRNVTEVAQKVLEKMPVAFGVGIVEDYNHETAMIEAIPAHNLEKREKELLDVSKSYMAKLPFEKLDVLIVDEMGKNISGVGMDPNVTGRSSPMGVFEPFVDKLVVRDLTRESDGSAYGVGNADIITRRLFDKIIFDNTYPNGITNHDLKPMMIPAVMPSDLNAIRMALCALSISSYAEPRMVWIHNTLCLQEMLCSEPLLEDARAVGAQIDDAPVALAFDEDGNLQSKLF